MALLDCPAVFAVVKDGKAEAVVGKVGPLVAADLELGEIPRCVGVGGAFDIAELDVKGGLYGVDINGIIGLERDVLFLPVDYIATPRAQYGIEYEYDV